MKIKKANVILEYGILIFIVTSFLAGIYYFLNRHIQARVKAEADRENPHSLTSSFIWEGTVTRSTQSTTHDRDEYVGGDTVVSSSVETTYVSASAPIPPNVPFASLHVQDAASAAPAPDYPDLEYKGWDDQGWPLH